MPLEPRLIAAEMVVRSDDGALPFIDSGRGSSALSMQSSKGIDSTDDEVVVPTRGRVKASGKNSSRKRKFREISGQQPPNSDDDETESILDPEVAEELEAEKLGLDSEELEPEVLAQEKKRFCVGIRVPPFVYPKSQYEGYEHPLPKEKEWLVVREFLRNEREKHILGSREIRAGSPEFFHSYRLEDFTIYCPSDRRLGCEMTILSNLSVKAGETVLLFDGVLTDGETERYLEGVPFMVLSVGNYADTTKHDVANNIWIQTDASQGLNVWYELGTPSKAYEHYYNPFLWLANFSKHVIDYLSENRSVVLEDFKHKFSAWITNHHSGNETFDNWYTEFGRDDFRQAVTAHRDWLWNQVYCCSKKLTRNPIWDEVLHLSAVKPVPGNWVEQTVVTPYVYDCFEHMFGDKMIIVKPPVDDTRSKFAGVHVPKSIRAKRDVHGNLCQDELLDIKVGDVVATERDQGSEWKGKSTIWYAYVQGIEYRKVSGSRPYALEVIWLYAPEDTVLSKEKYPYHNELFFSDHCNCGEEKLYVSDVLTRVSIGFFKTPGKSGEEFFIRQKYRTDEAAFLTLRQEDLNGCQHKKVLKSKYEIVKERYQPGDTVLVGSILDGKDILEPVEIAGFDEYAQEVEVRMLERRHRIEGKSQARPNELLYTEIVVSIKAYFIERRCHIRFIAEADVKAGRIPTPYDRDGTGDCFYISSKLVSGNVWPLDVGEFPPSFRQGFDPSVPPDQLQLPVLKGLDLFCGGGNFGRGIEEGGVVNMKWAVDIDTPAIHSYRANLRDPEAELYLGSINNYLRDAILGKHGGSIAEPGQVGFISAGSPCQGFSQANQHRSNEKSLRNCSLVASVATSVDVYRPLFGLLENVHGLATTRTMPDGQQFNVFSQLLCCLVGLGYQCQQFTSDAWSFGSPQSRTRLFLSIAAAGQTLPPRPPRSHEHPSTIRSKELFKAPNGQKFGGREMSGPCTYPPVTSSEGFGDLPWLGNHHVGVCIPYPDHRLSRIEGVRTRMLMAHVPKHDGSRYLNSWRGALDSGKMPKAFEHPRYCRSKSLKSCRSWSRLMERELCRTITTTLTAQCSYTGQWVHYEQDRLITILEARRAQSFPDDEVLIGNAAQAFKIVGNSVARPVALVWGLAIRYAYLGEVEED